MCCWFVVGIQLYTLRDQLEKDAAGTIRQVAKIGYRDVEIYSLYGKSPAEFKKILNDNGITPSSGHYLLRDVKANWEKHVEDAKTLKLKYMVNAILQPEERKSFDDYKRLVDVFNKAAETRFLVQFSGWGLRIVGRIHPRLALANRPAA